MTARRTALAVTAAALALAGCQASDDSNPATTPSVSATGLAGQPVDEILDGVIDTLASSSVRIKGALTAGGYAISYDVQRRAADAAKATILVDNHTVEVIRNEGNEYVRADAWYWTNLGPSQLREPAVAQQLAGKWAKNGIHSDYLAGATSFIDLSEALGESLANNEGVVKGGESIVNGVPTIALIDQQGSTIYVATSGPPYLIRLEAPDGVSRVDFSEHDQPVHIDDPPADQIVDLDTVV